MKIKAVNGIPEVLGPLPDIRKRILTREEVEIIMERDTQAILPIVSSPVIKCKKPPRKKCSFVAEVKGKR